MSGFYDLTGGSDGEGDVSDHDLQAAIDASLSDMIDRTTKTDQDHGGGAIQNTGGTSASSACGSSSTTPSVSSISKGKRPMRPSSDVSSGKESAGKRPRSADDGGEESRAKPPLFRLISTPSDKRESGTVSLRDVLTGEFTEALLSNYMIDMALLVEAQPRLASVPVVVVHGFKPNTEDARVLENQCRNTSPSIKLHHPELPQFGTQHAKMMVLKFALGVRVVITTANFIEQDVTSKTQGVWYQEFPLRESATCDFEDTLVDYLEKVGGPARTFGRTLRQYDFTVARVALVLSVPGTKPKHKGRDLHKYGHMRVRALLEREPGLPGSDDRDKVSCQFSSMASLSSNPNQWLMELLTSFMSQKDAANDWKITTREHRGGGGGAATTAPATDAATILKERLRLVWPTTEAVRTSTKGWASGGSIPCRTNDMFGGDFNRPDLRSFERNEPRPALKQLLRKWEGNPAVNRTTDAPHIKSYVRYRERGGGSGGKDKEEESEVDGDEVAWFLLTSSNLSRSAWGFLDKTSTQLLVRSFEIGVMFLPSLLGREGKRPNENGEHDDAFTCTPGDTGLTQRLPMSYSIEPGKGLPLELLPFPYRFPAPRYNFAAGDKPWVWDRSYPIPDHFGSTWTGVGS